MKLLQWVIRSRSKKVPSRARVKIVLAISTPENEDTTLPRNVRIHGQKELSISQTTYLRYTLVFILQSTYWYSKW
jgi:hypothetical protein